MSDMTPPPAPPVPPAPPAPPWTPTPASGAPGAGRPGPVNDTSKLIAALGFPIWPVAVVAILIDPYKDEKFVKFHAMQAIGLGLIHWIAVAVLQAFWFIPFVGWMLMSVAGLLGLIIFVFQIMFALRVYGGAYVEVPVVYDFVKSYIGD
jgi:uncharacterized membrane protein